MPKHPEGSTLDESHPVSCTRTLRSALTLAVLAVHAPSAPAFLDAFRVCDAGKLERLNRKLGGRVLDFTRNHGADHRVWSASLGEWRSLYAYVPPGYDGTRRFPSMLWLHGLAFDEKHFLEIVHHFDEGIRAGLFPPTVIVAPDASIRSRFTPLKSGSFYMNTRAGNFEDYIARDIRTWMHSTFALRPEREAHLISGASMGGYGAFNLAFKHKELFGTIAGIMPGLDSQYADCHGRYFSDYDPNCIGRRTDFPRHQVVGRFYGVILVRQGRIFDPLFGRFSKPSPEFIRNNNPVEMLVIHNVQPHDYEMFIAYGTQDEFNIDAQVEHFLDVAARRGIHPVVEKIDGGRHSVTDGVKSFPAMARWLQPRFAPYVPEGYRPMEGCSCEIRMKPMVSGEVRPAYLSPLPAAPGTLALR
jgi:S-formylglutathione hydrolase FrmB